MPAYETPHCATQTKDNGVTNANPKFQCLTRLQPSQSRPSSTMKGFLFFTPPPAKALVLALRMRTQSPPGQAAARSKLVGSLTSSWPIAMAKGGETKAHLSNSRCAVVKWC